MNTRKKVIKTVYKDEEDSEAESGAGDFSDSGSDAKISDLEHPSSDEDVVSDASGEDFDYKSNKTFTTSSKPKFSRKPKFTKNFIKQIEKQSNENDDIAPTPFSVKDLTEADKLLPSVLNLSESDSSDDEDPKPATNKHIIVAPVAGRNNDSDSEDDCHDVWSKNIKDDSEEVAKETFKELEQHKSAIEETKASILNYNKKCINNGEFDVSDLLAQGEEVISEPSLMKKKGRRAKDDSDSEMEDWEEVNDIKPIPKQGLQLIVDFPDGPPRKTKKLDIEMMMKRKLNRVKKEYQVYMHKVHVLCWLGHGNYVSRVLNDQDIMAAALSLVPSKECYPGERVDIKYVEQITTWFRDKLTLKLDKNEDKFRPKAPPLKQILLTQMKSRIVSAKKHLVFIFVSMLRALGLQCRIMFNFVTVPIKPPASELCSLSTKQKDDKASENVKDAKGNDVKKESKGKGKKSKPSVKNTGKISQIDGTNDETDISTDDMSSDDDYQNITQLDGNDDPPIKSKSTRTRGQKDKVPLIDDTVTVKSRNARAGVKKPALEDISDDKDVSPPKKARRCPSSCAATLEKPKVPARKTRRSVSAEPDTQNALPAKRTRKNASPKPISSSENFEKPKAPLRKARKSISLEPDTQKALPIKRTRKNASPVPISSSAENLEKPKAPLRKTRSSASSEPDTQKVLPARRTRKSVSPKPKQQDELPPPRKIKRPVTPKSDQESLPNKRSLSRKTTDTKMESATETKPRSRNSRSSSKSVKEEADSPKPKSSRKQPEKTSAGKKPTGKSAVTKDSKRTLTDYKDTSKVKSSPKSEQSSENIPKVVVTDVWDRPVEIKSFNDQQPVKKLSLSRKRSQTTILKTPEAKVDPKRRSRSNPAEKVEKSKYFDDTPSQKANNSRQSRKTTKKDTTEDIQRVSHRDLLSKSKAKPRNDVTGDLVNIIKSRVKQSKEESKLGIVKGKLKQESDADSDYLPVESPKRFDSGSDEDFKPTKISPKPSTSGIGRKVDRRVLSTDDETPKNKCDVWCEVFVEELEQWISVDVIKGKVHCESDIYKSCTHPVCYVVGWDNNNYLKDVTRRYVPHWNTVTRKQRAEPGWWDHSVSPWRGPNTPRDREEDDQLNRMQLEAPLPTSIGEYKNHPLYALQRHLLKFEAIYPADAAALGFVRKEPVYARECVYVCRSRDTWLKEAKVVRLGEKPYKVVKARPKWDRLSNKLITDKPLEVFGPWQTDDYEPPTAVDGMVPRNAYGNVELFKQCMLPRGTAHVKLPGLNRVAKKLNIDCAPAMTGFDFNGGWSHPVYDGFVVCKEFEEIITRAWLEDQEEQERKELEKLEARVYGNWRRLIKGLLIRERVNVKYGYERPPPEPANNKKNKAPRFVAKKKQ